jgi:hypothetical protein
MDATQQQQHLIAAAARLALRQLTRHIGEPGGAAMRVRPALLASVDQHAAEVRDALGARLRPEELAAYADGVADTAAGHGWDPSEALSADWAAASWPLLRLLAVCTLAGDTTVEHTTANDTTLDDAA